MKVHVIIPVGPSDSSVLTLIHDLLLLDTKPSSVTVSFARSEDEVLCRFLMTALRQSGVHVKAVCGTVGRSRQQNKAVQSINGYGVSSESVTRDSEELHNAKITTPTVEPDDYLWFLHSDTRLDRESLTYLKISLASEPEGLHYFNLRFQDDGSRLMRFNTIGVWIRSHLMFMPFGDQGLCLKVKNFNRLGMFNESISRGEDHDLVWKAHVDGVPLVCAHANVITSARNYEGRWFSTTILTMKTTAEQALPYVPKVLISHMNRFFKSRSK